MRTKLAMLNTAFGITNQVSLAVLKIIIRKVMIFTIGIEFLGINGLFTNVLSMLSLAESGFGIAVVYKLYKPIADDDKIKICRYLNFYSTIYKIIAIIITVVGLAITPLIPFVLKETTLPIRDIYVYYIMFLLQNVASYFVAYKTAFLTACQKSYLSMIVNTVVTVIFSGVQIIVLLATHNYYIYLGVVILNTLTINLIVSIMTDKQYPYLKGLKKYPIDQQEKREIFQNCKALMYHRVGAYVLTGTDNIIISAFVSVTAVGLYSNYLVILGLLNNTLAKLFDAVGSSMGNIYAKDGICKTYDTYNMAFFLSFEVHMFCTAMFMILAQPFIRLVFGEEYLLDAITVAILAANFYIVGLRRHTTVIKNALGVFYQDRYSAFLEATINLVISIILVKCIGLPGVFIGTLISGLLCPSFIGPYFLYRDLFRENFRKYILKYTEYLFIGGTVIIGTYFALNIFQFTNDLEGFILLLLVSSIFVGAICLAIGLMIPERRYTKKYFELILRSTRCKVKLKG